MSKETTTILKFCIKSIERAQIVLFIFSDYTRKKAE